MAVVPADQLTPETNREHFDPNLVPSGDQEMAQLMDKDQRGQDDDKGQHIVEQPGEQIHEPTLPAGDDAYPTIGSARAGADKSNPPDRNAVSIA